MVVNKKEIFNLLDGKESFPLDENTDFQTEVMIQKIKRIKKKGGIKNNYKNIEVLEDIHKAPAPGPSSAPTEKTSPYFGFSFNDIFPLFPPIREGMNAASEGTNKLFDNLEKMPGPFSDLSVPRTPTECMYEGGIKKEPESKFFEAIFGNNIKELAVFITMMYDFIHNKVFGGMAESFYNGLKDTKGENKHEKMNDVSIIKQQIIMLFCIFITTITVYNWFFLIYYTDMNDKRSVDNINEFIYHTKCGWFSPFFMFFFCGVVPFFENFNNFFIRRGDLINHYVKYDKVKHSNIKEIFKKENGEYIKYVMNSTTTTENEPDNLFVYDQTEYNYRNEIYNTLQLLSGGTYPPEHKGIGELGWLSKNMNGEPFLTNGLVFFLLYGFIFMGLYFFTPHFKNFIVDSLLDKYKNPLVAFVFVMTTIYILYYNNLIRTIFSGIINITQLNTKFWPIIFIIIIMFIFLFIICIIVVSFLGKISVSIIGFCFLIYFIYNSFPLDFIKAPFIYNLSNEDIFKDIYGEEVYNIFKSESDEMNEEMKKIPNETDKYLNKMNLKTAFYRRTHFIPIIAKIMEYINRKDEKKNYGDNEFMDMLKKISPFLFKNTTNIFLSIILFVLFIQSITQIKNTNVKVTLSIIQGIFFVFWSAFSIFGVGAFSYLEEGLKYQYFDAFFERGATNTVVT